MRCKRCGKEIPAGKKLYCSTACITKANRQNQNKKRQAVKDASEQRKEHAASKGTLLSIIARNARACGMSYGQYMAIRYLKNGQKAE